MSNTSNDAHDRWLLPGDVAILFGVTTKCLRDWVDAGLLESQRTLGGHRRYRESTVRALLAERRNQPEPVKAVA